MSALSAQTDMVGAALEWASAGCSVIRVRTDGTKAPLGEWKEFQRQRANDDVLSIWFNEGHPGLGIVCGAVSGNLELLEFEGRAVSPESLGQFGAYCEAAGIGDLWAGLISSGYVARSPSGGLHVVYRCDEPVTGNQKLAERLARDEEWTADEVERAAEVKARNGSEWTPKRTLVETRGEGGFFVAPPSHGPVHPSGNAWVAVGGCGPDRIITLTAEQRDALLGAARLLDELPAPQYEFPTAKAPLQPVGDDGLTPGEDFNTRGTWEEVLEPHGWRRVKRHGDKTLWRRPGKNIGISAITGGDYGDYMTVFTTSTELPDNRAMQKWRVYTLLNYGDSDEAFQRAAGDLRRLGYGGNRPAQPSALEFSAKIKALDWPSANGNAEPVQPKPESANRLRYYLVDEDGLEGLPDPAPLIDGTLDQSTVAMLAGYKGTFKSLTALDWAASVASGVPWQDRPVESGPVLYVAAEGALGIRNRLRAWRHARGVPSLGGQFHVMRRAVNLGKRNEYMELAEIAFELRPMMVVIDTLNRCSVGKDENSAKDMGEIVETLYGLQELTIEGRGCVILIHHAGKDQKTVRGSSALEAGMDTVYTTARDADADDLVHLNRTKRKDGIEQDHLRFTFHAVPDTDSGVLVQPGHRVVGPVDWGKEKQYDFLILGKLIGFPIDVGLGPTAIVQETGLNKSAVNRSLRRLESVGHVERCSRGQWRATDAGARFHRGEDPQLH